MLIIVGDARAAADLGRERGLAYGQDFLVAPEIVSLRLQARREYTLSRLDGLVMVAGAERVIGARDGMELMDVLTGAGCTVEWSDGE